MDEPDWADKPEAVPYSSLDNPQSLNLYGYVLNNPLSKADADGHWPDWDSTGGQILIGLGKAAYNSTVAVARTVVNTTYNIANGNFSIAPSGAMSAANEDQAAGMKAGDRAIAMGTLAIPAGEAAPIAEELGAGEATRGGSVPSSSPESVPGGQAPDQVTPGTTNVKGTYNSPNRGADEPYSAHYDQYGRQTGRTDYTSQPDPKTHTHPHHHTREYGPGYGSKGKETGPNPGPHPKDKP